jgi:hypothetical protein
MKAIHETGFKGYVAQEFIPKNLNKLESLKRQLQFVIFNDYKNRTHDKKEELLINTGLALGAIALLHPLL